MAIARNRSTHCVQDIDSVTFSMVATNNQKRRVRATVRPKDVKAPAHWQHSVAPEPRPVDYQLRADEKGRPDPVRFGDWEKDGIAIDF